MADIKKDGAFDKAWKKNCPHCQSNRILFFQHVCHQCTQNALKILKLM